MQGVFHGATHNREMEFQLHHSPDKGRPPDDGLVLSNVLDDTECSSGFGYIRRNILAPFANSALVEPTNAVASVLNGLSGRELISPVKHLESAPVKFLSENWFWQTAASGCGMILPYLTASKLSGGTLRLIGSELGAKGTTAAVLKSEILAGVTGAALYDGMRVPREGETRAGNILGGMAAFTVFGAGNYWMAETKGAKKILGRAAIGFAGADAQLITSHLVSQGHLPSSEKLVQAGVSGVLMNNLLPPANRMVEELYIDSRLGLGLSVAADQYAAVKLTKQRAMKDATESDNLCQQLYDHPWVRVRNGKHNDFSSDKHGTISLWGRLSGAEELARGLHRLGDAKLSTGSAIEWQASLDLAQSGRVNEAWDLFRELRATQEAAAHHAGQRVAGQLGNREVLPLEIIRLEIAAWPAPGGVSFEYRWRQEFSQFIESGGKWRPGQSVTTEAYRFAGEQAEPASVHKKGSAAEIDATMEQHALQIVKELQADHHIATIVGGAVRDRLRGMPARDYDVSTSASPGQVKTLFKSKGYEVVDTPYPFVKIVKINDINYEIASFEGRRAGVGLSASLFHDCALRDVTINSMAMEPTTGTVFDFFGGRRDLEAKMLRTIQHPDTTFATDIRILMRLPRMRATKFSDFEVSDSVIKAMTRNASAAATLPPNWVARELSMIMSGAHRELGLSMLETTGIARHIGLTAESSGLAPSCPK